MSVPGPARACRRRDQVSSPDLLPRILRLGESPVERRIRRHQERCEGDGAVRVRRPPWQVLLAAVGCLLLAIAVGVVGMALNPQEGVNLAELMAVGLTSVALAGSLLVWVRGSTARLAGSPTPASAAVAPQPHGEASGVTSPAPAVAVPRQLPAVVAGFAGRVAELAALTSRLDESAGASGTVVISAVDGMAGIGKTALAVRWAHQVADRFPDGQLYVNLRGFDPVGSPMAPA